MDLLVDGFSNQEIARRLGISYQTVKLSLSSWERKSNGEPSGIYGKMGIFGVADNGRVQAALAYLGYRSLKARGLLGNGQGGRAIEVEP